MNATKPLSTKLPLVWQATLQPSNLFKSIYIGCVSAALVALSLCPVDMLFRFTLIILTTTGSIAIYLPTRKTRSLAWCENDTWLYFDGETNHNGSTATGSYRSLAVVVVAIKSDTGRKSHAVVWCDSVSREIFSALHLRLALTTADQLQ